MREVTRSEVEDFLYHEAELLDTWQTMEWAELYTEDCEYLIPPIQSPEADKDAALFIINDDRHRLLQRAKRLTRRTAHAEYPHSQVRHMVHNVRLTGRDETGVDVAYNLVVYRSKRQITDTYIGHVRQRLVFAEDGGFRISSKRVMLDIDALRPHGRVSIIL